MDTALLCQSCSWFGVYRADVTARISACPVCGRPALSARGVEEDHWHRLGQQLLSDEPAAPQEHQRIT